MGTSSTTEAMQRWEKQLEESRQPWPEWQHLEQLASSTVFTLESDEDVPFPNQFHAGPRDPAGYRIVRSVLTPPQETQFRSAIANNIAFPKYLLPLLDLKYSDSLMMAGGIAGKLCPMSTEGDVELPPPLGPDICLTDPYTIYNKDPSQIIWPDRPTFPLQTNSFGVHFYADQEGNVTSFSPRNCTFARIGSTNDLIRYCLAAILNRQDWYKNYAKRVNLAEYKLAHFDDVGID